MLFFLESDEELESAPNPFLHSSSLPLCAKDFLYAYLGKRERREKKKREKRRTEAAVAEEMGAVALAVGRWWRLYGYLRKDDWGRGWD